MVYDPEIHEIDPVSGFALHKNTGHIVGIEQQPPAAKSDHEEFPKWVDVHESHLDGGVAQDFAQTEHTRAGKFRVLVHDGEEEAKAVAEKVVVAVEHDKAQHDLSAKEASEAALKLQNENAARELREKEHSAATADWESKRPVSGFPANNRPGSTALNQPVRTEQPHEFAPEPTHEEFK